VPHESANSVAGNSPRATLKSLGEEIRRNPQDSHTYHRMAAAYGQRREFEPACEFLQKAISLDRQNPKYWCDLATSFSWLGDSELELDALQSALALDPCCVDACMRLAAKASERGDLKQARKYFDKALNAAPMSREACEGLCATYLEEYGEAEAQTRTAAALTMSSDAVPVLKALAAALQSRGRYEQALGQWSKVLLSDPSDSTALMEAANAEVALRRFDSASRLFRLASAAAPESSAVALATAHFAFRTGCLDDACEIIRHALVRSVLKPHWLASQPAAAPIWTGAENIAGKTVLVECAGAFGDNIQFARFASLMKVSGAKVVLQCLPPLQDILRSMQSVDEVITPYDECAPIDYQCRADIAMFLSPWTWDWIKRDTPYIVPSNGQTVFPLIAPDNLPRVGIVWRSQSLSTGPTVPAHKQTRNHFAFRSIPLELLQPLSESATVYGLQVGPGTEEIRSSTRAWMTQNFEADFSRTTAIIMAMDAIVTVDSAMAHLAGALGKTCFLMLPYYPEFRWMTETNDFFNGSASAWYPATSVFRQPRPGDWHPVVSDIAERLPALRSVRP